VGRTRRPRDSHLSHAGLRPPRSPPFALDPSGLGHAATFTRRLRDPPVSERRHFGVPNSIITDNGTQFTGKKFLDFCEDHHICVDWAAVAHPMTNRQVERANGMLLQGLKSRIYNDLNKFGKRWMKELPSVVWSLRTMPSRAMGFSPFFLVYGTEAILPTDLEYGSSRTKAYDDRSNQTS
jgi:transposase InsO family protein